MPKDTFFNLPDEKRALINDIALDEFAQYPFDQASVNRIVTNAGIAKGSFYQYFEDKKDLFFYLVGLIAEEKVKYLTPVLRNPDEHDIFTLVRELFAAGIQFTNEHPRYAAIGNQILVNNREAPIYKELKADGLPDAYDTYELLLEKAIARGEVRADIDTRILNYVIASMNVAVVEYCSEFHSQKMYESVLATADVFLDILKNGIGAKSNGQQPTADR